MFPRDKKIDKKHGVFIYDEDVMSMGKCLLNSFNEDTRKELEENAVYNTPEYAAFYKSVPFVEYLSIPENHSLIDWKVKYCDGDENIYSNDGVFISSEGKSDDHFVKWLSEYLNVIPDTNWYTYLADCEIEHFVY